MNQGGYPMEYNHGFTILPLKTKQKYTSFTRKVFAKYFTLL
jgi:hypothetical protein